MAVPKKSESLAKANPFTALVPKGQVAPPINSGSSSPYMILLHSQQNTYGTMVKNLKISKSGTPVYVNGEKMQAFDPLKFIMTPTYFQCYAIHNSDGSLEDVLPAEGRCPKGHKDTIFAVILIVDSNHKVFPARIRLQGPRAKGFKDAILYILSECENPDWASRSKDHKLTTGSGLPSFCYAVHDLQVETRNPKSTEDGQKPYELTSVASNPTPGLTLKGLKDAMTDDEFLATMQACIDDYENEIPKQVALAA